MWIQVFQGGFFFFGMVLPLVAHSKWDGPISIPAHIPKALLLDSLGILAWIQHSQGFPWSSSSYQELVQAQEFQEFLS